jgi:hypothetical protein
LKLKGGTTFGKVLGADRRARTLDVRKGRTQAARHPTALFAHSRAPIETLEASIFQSDVSRSDIYVEGLVDPGFETGVRRVHLRHVFEFAKAPRLYVLCGSLSEQFRLEATQYRARP